MREADRGIHLGDLAIVAGLQGLPWHAWLAFPWQVQGHPTAFARRLIAKGVSWVRSSPPALVAYEVVGQRVQWCTDGPIAFGSGGDDPVDLIVTVEMPGPLLGGGKVVPIAMIARRWDVGHPTNDRVSAGRRLDLV